MALDKNINIAVRRANSKVIKIRIARNRYLPESISSKVVVLNGTVPSGVNVGALALVSQTVLFKYDGFSNRILNTGVILLK